MVCGLQAGYVLDLAKHFQSGQLSDEKIATMDDDTLVAELTKVKGIGGSCFTTTSSCMSIASSFFTCNVLRSRLMQPCHALTCNIVLYNHMHHCHI